MDRDEAGRIHQTLVGELQETERQLRETEQRTSALRQLVEGYEALFPDLRTEVVDQSSPDEETTPVKPAAKHPRGKKAAIEVLRDAGRWMSISDIVDDMIARGWDPKSEDAVRTTLSRLFKDDKLIEKGQLDGRTLAYRWPPQEVSAIDAEHGDGPAGTGPSAGQEGGNDDLGHHRHPAIVT